jgi:hypothetical protein
MLDLTHGIAMRCMSMLLIWYGLVRITRMGAAGLPGRPMPLDHALCSPSRTQDKQPKAARTDSGDETRRDAMATASRRPTRPIAAQRARRQEGKPEGNNIKRWVKQGAGRATARLDSGTNRVAQQVGAHSEVWRVVVVACLAVGAPAGLHKVRAGQGAAPLWARH